MKISKCGLSRRVLEFRLAVHVLARGKWILLYNDFQSYMSRRPPSPFLIFPTSRRRRIDVTKLDSGMHHIDSGYRDVGRSGPVRAIPAFQLELLENRPDLEICVVTAGPGG